MAKKAGYFSEFSPTRNVQEMTRNIAGDTLAGIIVSLIMLPMALCFGLLACGTVQVGMNIMMGVYATIAAGLFIGILGGTPGALSGPTAVTAMMCLAIFSTYPKNPGVAMGIFALAGLIQIALGLGKVSHALEYVPRPIIAGIQNAAAIFLLISGVLMVAGHLPVYPLSKVPGVFSKLAANPETAKVMFNSRMLYVASMAFFVTLVGTLVSRFIPSGLIGLALATTLAVVGRFPTDLVPRITVPKTGFWPFPVIPSLGYSSMETIMALVSALAFAFISASLLQQNTELASNLTGRGHSSNREMFALGLVNSMSWLIGALPVTGSADETRVSIAAKGRSPFVSIVAALTMFMVVIFLALGLKYVPLAAFGGLAVFMSFRAVDWETTLSIPKLPVVELVAMLLVMFSMLFTHFVIAAFLAAILTLVLLTRRMGNLLEDQIMTLKPTERRWVGEDLIPPELRKVIVFARPDSPLTLYETLVQVSEQTLNNRNFKALIVRLNRIPTLDESAVAALARMVHIAKERQGIVFFTGIKPKLRTELDEWGLTDMVGKKNIFARFTVAAQYLTERLGQSAAVQMLGLQTGTREWEGQILYRALKNYVLMRKLKDTIALLAASLIAAAVSIALGFVLYALVVKVMLWLRSPELAEAISPVQFGVLFAAVLLTIVVILIIRERRSRRPLITSHAGATEASTTDAAVKIAGGCLLAIPSYVAFTAEEVINLMSKRFREDVLINAGRILALIQVDMPYSFIKEQLGATIEYDVREALMAVRDLDLASWAPNREDFTVALTEEGRKFVEREIAEAMGRPLPED